MTAIISDIHGNFPALRAVLKKIGETGCGEIISLGDVAGYYCMVNECVQELRARNIVNIMGNHDEYIVMNTRCPRSNAANECLDAQRKTITAENVEWLSRSSRMLRRGDISMAHGGWNDFTDEYIYKAEEPYFEGLEGTLFLSGHTHIQTVQTFSNGKTYCNPGSVGQPRDGDSRAAFAVVDGGRVSLMRVEYDIGEIADAMRAEGFPEYYYDNLRAGRRIGDR